MEGVGEEKRCKLKYDCFSHLDDCAEESEMFTNEIVVLVLHASVEIFKCRE